MTRFCGLGAALLVPCPALKAAHLFFWASAMRRRADALMLRFLGAAAAAAGAGPEAGWPAI
jgi:hypothetical protein